MLARRPAKRRDDEMTALTEARTMMMLTQQHVLAEFGKAVAPMT